MSAGVELFSHIAKETGHDLEKILNYDTFILSSHGLEEYASFNKEYNFPNILSRELGLDHYQASRGGSCNHRITIDTVRDLKRLRSEYPGRRIYALITWTLFTRGLYIPKSDRMFPIDTVAPFTEGLVNTVLQSQYKRHYEYYFSDFVTKNVLEFPSFNRIINNVCDELNIKPMFNFAFYDQATFIRGGVYRDVVGEQLSKIDYSRYLLHSPRKVVTLKDFANLTLCNSFDMFTEENGFRRSPNRHPGKEAHNAYADLLIPLAKKVIEA